jgi:hypothetical protein
MGYTGISFAVINAVAPKTRVYGWRSANSCLSYGLWVSNLGV